MDVQTRYLWGVITAFIVLSGLFTWSWIYQRINTFSAGNVPTVDLAPKLPPTLPAIRPQDPRFGSTRPDALEIVEFADYQCLHCRSMASDLHAIVKDTNRNVRLIWREAPTSDTSRERLLPFVASRCAHTQGQFVAMHEALFSASTYTDASLNDLAEQLGLDTRRFASCLQDPLIFSSIQRDQSLALVSNITAAPTFFIRGVPHVGSYTRAELDELLQP